MEEYNVIAKTLGFKDWEDYIKSDPPKSLQLAVKWICSIHGLSYGVV